MKTKCILLILCLFCTSIGFSQNKLFDKYADMDDVTSIYISKAMLQLMPKEAKIGKIGLDIKNINEKIESLQLASSEKPDKIAQMKKDFSQLITAKHQELMRMKEGKSNVNIYSLTQGDRIKELIMLVEENDTFTVIQLTGNFTLNDIKENIVF